MYPHIQRSYQCRGMTHKTWPICFVFVQEVCFKLISCPFPWAWTLNKSMSIFTNWNHKCQRTLFDLWHFRFHWSQTPLLMFQMEDQMKACQGGCRLMSVIASMETNPLQMLLQGHDQSHDLQKAHEECDQSKCASWVLHCQSIDKWFDICLKVTFWNKVNVNLS